MCSKYNVFDVGSPQLFPGLIYRMIKPKVVLLIFVSGKIVLTGAKVGANFLNRDHTIDRSTRVLIAFSSGPRGDLYGFQHDLHRALRIPQAISILRRQDAPAWTPSSPPPRIRPPREPCLTFFRMSPLPGHGSSAGVCMILLIVSRLRFLRRR